MSDKNKKILYSTLFILGLSVFILQVFVFSAPDGLLGFVICLVSIYLILGSFIKMCKISKKFKDYFINILDLLFWLP